MGFQDNVNNLINTAAAGAFINKEGLEKKKIAKQIETENEEFGKIESQIDESKPSLSSLADNEDFKKSIENFKKPEELDAYKYGGLSKYDIKNLVASEQDLLLSDYEDKINKYYENKSKVLDYHADRLEELYKNKPSQEYYNLSKEAREKAESFRAKGELFSQVKNDLYKSIGVTSEMNRFITKLRENKARIRAQQLQKFDNIKGE